MELRQTGFSFHTGQYCSGLRKTNQEYASKENSFHGSAAHHLYRYSHIIKMNRSKTNSWELRFFLSLPVSKKTKDIPVPWLHLIWWEEKPLLKSLGKLDFRHCLLWGTIEAISIHVCSELKGRVCSTPSSYPNCNTKVTKLPATEWIMQHVL